MIIFKNFFSYGLTYKAYDWLQQNQTTRRLSSTGLARCSWSSVC